MPNIALPGSLSPYFTPPPVPDSTYIDLCQALGQAHAAAGLLLAIVTTSRTQLQGKNMQGGSGHSENESKRTSY